MYTFIIRMHNLLPGPLITLAKPMREKNVHNQKNIAYGLELTCMEPQT